MNAILLQVDDVRVKPVSFVDVTKLINEKLSNSSPNRDKQEACGCDCGTRKDRIDNWLSRVDKNKDLTAIALNYQA